MDLKRISYKPGVGLGNFIKANICLLLRRQQAGSVNLNPELKEHIDKFEERITSLKLK
jgi:hypothetical protein